MSEILNVIAGGTIDADVCSKMSSDTPVCRSQIGVTLLQRGEQLNEETSFLKEIARVWQ
jgi:hypothetical protein